MSESGLVRVVDFNDDEKKKFIKEEKFRKGKSRQGSPRQEADVYVIYCDDFDENESLMKDSESKIQSLKNDIQAKDKTIERLENELSSIYSDNKKEMDDLKDEYDEEVNQLKKDLHEKDLEIERTKTKYEKEIGQIKEANRNHVNDIKIFDKEKHITIKDHQDKVDELKEEIDDLKSKLYDEEKHMKIKDHNSAVNGIKNRIVETLLPHNDNINRLDSIGLLGYIKGDLKEVRKDLKKDIQAFEDISHYIESKNENVIVELKKEKEADEDSS